MQLVGADPHPTKVHDDGSCSGKVVLCLQEEQSMNNHSCIRRYSVLASVEEGTGTPGQKFELDTLLAFLLIKLPEDLKL